MLDLGHLGHEVGHLDQRRLRVAAGDHDVLVRVARGKPRKHGVEIEIVVAEHDVELVEHHEAIGGVGQELLRRLPRLARSSEVALAVLRVPGEAFAHHADRDEVGEALQHRTLAGRPLPLHELHHAHLHAVADGACREAEGSGRLALALAGVDDEQALLDGLGGQHALARRLALAHLLGMAPVELSLGLVRHQSASCLPSRSAASRA